MPGPRTEPSGPDRCRTHRFADHRRHGLVGGLHRHDALPADRPHARPQPQHAVRRSAHPPVGGALPGEQGGPAAVARRVGARRQRDQRLLRRGPQERRRIQRQGDPELGSRPVGQPAVGQTQGRGGIPRLGRGGPGHANDARRRGGHGLFRADGAGSRTGRGAPHGGDPRGEHAAGPAAFRRRPDLRDGLPAGESRAGEAPRR